MFVKMILCLNYLIYMNYCQLATSLEYEIVTDEKDTERSKRNVLLFPNSTLLQFNAGIATLSPVKGINVNWVFQANFQLPWNRTQIPDDILNANSGYEGDSRMNRDIGTEEIRYENNFKLYHFYKYVEDVLNGFGHNGTSCVLKAMCHLAADPLYSADDEDILHEIASFVLDPRNDITSPTDDEAKIYIQAFQDGRNSNDCSKYAQCSFPLVDTFTRLHSFS